MSIFIQGKEFHSQLKEMTITAKEMQAQSLIYTEQLNLLKLQNQLLSRQIIEAQIQDWIKAQPFLVIAFQELCDDQIHVTLSNHGSTVYGVTVDVVEIDPTEPYWIALLNTDEKKDCVINFDESISGLPADHPYLTNEMTLHVRYVTRLGVEMDEYFKMTTIQT